VHAYDAKLPSPYVKEKGKDKFVFIILLVFFNLFMLIIMFYLSGVDKETKQICKIIR